MTDQTPTPEPRGGIGHGSCCFEFHRFRPRGIEHEAVLVTHDNVIEIIANGDDRVAFPSEIGGELNDDVVMIQTPIGRFDARIPFYLCRNARGDLYRYNREIHEAMYERIGDEP